MVAEGGLQLGRCWQRPRVSESFPALRFRDDLSTRLHKQRRWSGWKGLGTQQCDMFKKLPIPEARAWAGEWVVGKRSY